MAKIRAVAFDIIETVFPLEPLRARFVSAGLSADDLETWFATGLRDAFALTASQSYTPFPDILKSALLEVVRSRGLMQDVGVESILAGLSELDCDPGAAAAFGRARDAGLTVVALTNGGADSTRKLLERSKLKQFVAMEISVEEIKRFKPSREVYLHAASRAGVEPTELGLVAAHGWDVHGAKLVGLKTAYVQRKSPIPDFMVSPDMVAKSLLEAVEGLLDV